ncbi:MAG: coenzyme F420-0:L-glutamate ligase [Gammaproteobacteria bacterium]|nr:coenzyme F420-0:L-glutamate ligase [Gammaproteobacteria bacterium]
MGATVSFTALPGIGEVTAGTDLAAVVAESLLRAGMTLQPGDILVVAQKVVSKAEGRHVDLATVTPSAQALELAAVTRKDPRLVQLVLDESSDVLRAVPNVLVVRHRCGFVMANAGIDRSNSGPRAAGQEIVVLLPREPDASASGLREALRMRLGVAPGVIISDSFGRPWRNGSVNVALGVAGLASLVDRRGEKDRDGRVLEATEVAYADALAAGAGLVMGEGGEGTPMVLVRGWSVAASEHNGGALIRPLAEDLFQ